MPETDEGLRVALESFQRELDRMLNEGEVQQANELVAAVCARFAIETARMTRSE